MFASVIDFCDIACEHRGFMANFRRFLSEPDRVALFLSLELGSDVLELGE